MILSALALILTDALEHVQNGLTQVLVQFDRLIHTAALARCRIQPNKNGNRLNGFQSQANATTPR